MVYFRIDNDLFIYLFFSTIVIIFLIFTNNSIDIHAAPEVYLPSGHVKMHVVHVP